MPFRPCSDICVDIFSNCFEFILVLGDLWPEQMGCSNFPSGSACFKPSSHDSVLEDGAVYVGNDGLAQTFDNREISTSVATDDTRVLDTNNTVRDWTTAANVVEINQGGISDSEMLDHAESTTESKAAASSTRHAKRATATSENPVTSAKSDLTAFELTTQESPTTNMNDVTQTCEEVTLESCSKYYNETVLPNSYGHETQFQAGESLTRLFVSVGDLNSRYCAEYLESFLCSSLLPPCGTGEMVLRYSN